MMRQNNPNKVLVTGGLGYIGQVLVRQLLDQGKQVRVFDVGWFGSSGLERLENVEIVKGDIRNYPLDDLMKDVGCVCHLASLSNDPTADFDPKMTEEINHLGTVRVAEACIRSGVKVMTFASSASVYGFNVEEICTEQSQLNPQSDYALSKVKAEMALQQMAEPQKFFPIIFRQATVVGYSPRMRFDLVLNTMVRDAFAEKKIKAVDCYRPLIDVNDVAFCHTIMTDLTIYRLSMFDWSPTTQTKFQIMNVKKKNYRIADLGRELQAILLKDGIKVDLELIDKDSADHRSYQISANKARDVFGFTPLIGTDQSAPKMWDVLKHKKIEDPFDRKYYNLKVMEKYAKHG